MEKVFHMSSVLNDLENVKPIYIEFKGWSNSVMDATTFNELPLEAKEYIDFLSNELEVPIEIISVGPKRDQIPNEIDQSGYKNSSQPDQESLFRSRKETGYEHRGHRSDRGGDDQENSTKNERDGIEMPWSIKENSIRREKGRPKEEKRPRTEGERFARLIQKKTLHAHRKGMEKPGLPRPEKGRVRDDPIRKDQKNHESKEEEEEHRPDHVFEIVIEGDVV